MFQDSNIERKYTKGGQRDKKPERDTETQSVPTEIWLEKPKPTWNSIR